MAYLPLANLLQHKLRSVLSALGIGIGICMLITLSGLSRGSLYEVADRWEAVHADLFAYPDIWEGSVSSLSGVGLPDRYAHLIAREHRDIVSSVVPVFLWQVRLAGQGQLAAGVDPWHFAAISGGRKPIQGRIFDPDSGFSGWMERTLLGPPSDDGGPLDIGADDLGAADHNGMEVVVDSRLATAADIQLGQKVQMAGHDFTVVGIVPAGGLSRVYLPRRTAQFLFGSGDITKSTLLFIKLHDGVDQNMASRAIARAGVDVVQIRQFRQMLTSQFAIMFVYVDAVNAVAIVIAFLFIMVTLYTIVLQRTRDIAILKTSGASGAFIVRQIVAESLLLTLAGTAMGIVMSLAADVLIEAMFPLLTVRIGVRWILTGLAVAAAGAMASAAYPAWRATRIDMVKALNWE